MLKSVLMVFRGLFITSFFLIIFIIHSHAQAGPGNSQRARPALFAHLPEKLQIDSLTLHQIFLKSPGDTIDLLNKPIPAFRAVVTEKAERDEGYSSLNLKLVQFPGTLVTISKSINLRQNIVFRGRIIHPSFRDMYIMKLIDGKYYIIRQPVSKILAE